MPTPERTSVPEIVAAATVILERGGLDAVTMQAVAAAVGVRAPSLYKRVRDRDALIGLVAEGVARDLGAALDAAALRGAERDGAGGDRASAGRGRRARIEAFAHAVRGFAKARPESYSLLFARLPESAQPDPAVLAGSIAQVLRLTGEAAGQERALDAARTLTAWVHGFVSIELAGRFRMGDDVDRAFAFGAARLAEALDAE